MEAKELRIGNYVLTAVPGQQIPIPAFKAQVQAISLFGEVSFLYNPTDCTGFEMHRNHIAGIPLTEEILLKAGFYKAQYLTDVFIISPLDKSGLYFYFDKNFEGADDENIIGDYDECVHIRLPKYVHQLQNLYFALTGEELEINL